MAVIISTRQRRNSSSNVKVTVLAVFEPEVNCILISEYFPLLYWYCLRINVLLCLDEKEYILSWISSLYRGKSTIYL